MAKATILTGTEHNGAAPMVTLYITGHALKRRHLAAILGSQVLSWLGDGAGGGRGERGADDARPAEVEGRGPGIREGDPA